jgi:hypothetical protein
MDKERIGIHIGGHSEGRAGSAGVLKAGIYDAHLTLQTKGSRLLAPYEQIHVLAVAQPQWQSGINLKFSCPTIDDLELDPLGYVPE